MPPIPRERRWATLLAVAFVISAVSLNARQNANADDAPASITKFHGYDRAVSMQRGNVHVILCPQAGGRVLQFSLAGKDAMYLEEAEKSWKPGTPSPASAGRFDFGPELTTAQHPAIWNGEWTVDQMVGFEVRMTSPKDSATGIQVTREFKLHQPEPGGAAHLSCRQTLTNVSDKVRSNCHWGRSFSPGGGICLIPLGDVPSRFPSKYAMYEDSAIINVRAKDERIRERDGFLEILAPPRKPKLGFDSYAGWLAYAIPNDMLFVKRFKTHPNRVYSEAAGLTISVWYPEGPRIELEPIGPKEVLEPGQSATFTEEWWLFPYAYPKPKQDIDLRDLQRQVDEKTK